MRTLRITSGPAAGQEMELEKELVVGREGADLVILDEEMSRRHAVLRPVDAGVEVEDLGSTNGTLVDGRRITGPVTIAIRGAVKIGTSEIRVNVSLAQETTIASVGQSTRATDVTPPPDVTAPRQVPAMQPDVTAPRRVPQEPAPAAPAPAAPAPAAPAAGASDQSQVESPQLPLPASFAIFIAALVAIVAVLVLFD